MGDVSEMMLDGTLCQCCGTYLGPEPENNFDKSAENWEPAGFPQNCEDCE